MGHFIKLLRMLESPGSVLLLYLTSLTTIGRHMSIVCSALLGDTPFSVSWFPYYTLNGAAHTVYPCAKVCVECTCNLYQTTEPFVRAWKPVITEQSLFALLFSFHSRNCSPSLLLSQNTKTFNAPWVPWPLSEKSTY